MYVLVNLLWKYNHKTCPVIMCGIFRLLCNQLQRHIMLWMCVCTAAIMYCNYYYNEYSLWPLKIVGLSGMSVCVKIIYSYAFPHFVKANTTCQWFNVLHTGRFGFAICEYVVGYAWYLAYCRCWSWLVGRHTHRNEHNMLKVSTT